MVIQEYAQFERTLAAPDRALLDSLVSRIAGLTVLRGVVPEGTTLAARIQQAGKGLTVEESKALAAYCMAAIVSSQTFGMQSTMQPMLRALNIEYLELQNSMQNENRNFKMVSNIMKTKHDTVKNSISNVR